MTERHADLLELFLGPAAQGAADGSRVRPFRDLDAAAESLAKTHLTPAIGNLSQQHPKRLDLVYLEGAKGATPLKGRPQYSYFIDVHSSDEAGDGTELHPWPSFEAAIQGLRRRHMNNGDRLRPGSRIRLTFRQIFTATRIERAKRRHETIAKYVLLGMTLLLVIPLLFILGYLLVKAWPALSLSLLLQNPQNRMTAGGIWAPLVGTFCLVLLSLLIAAPIGILAGVYLNEYARDNWLTRIINLAVMNLAGVPSIVHGLFGVGAFVYFAHMSPSLLAASCTVAVMTLPVIITSTREALAAVPMSFRVACWNMGASRWQTIRTIVLPNAISGILTGVILQVSRAAGETAPILFTGAVYYVKVPDSGLSSLLPYSLNEPFMALSYHLFALSTQVKGVSEELQFGTAVVLIGLVLLVNSVSIAFRVYLRSRKKW
jgi:phosphate transport system permease protein